VIRTLLWISVALVIGCGPGRVVRRGEVNVDLLAHVRTQLAAVRGLAFRSAVPARALTPDEIRTALQRELDQSYAPGDLERLGAVYHRLRLLPPETALRPALERLYESQIAAFYDPRTKELAIATQALHAGGFWLNLLTTVTGIDLVGEMLVAHEYTHALQDQHWGLPTQPDPLTSSHSDRMLARRALLEGDATLASVAYLQGSTPSGSTLERVVRELRAVPVELARQYPEIPEPLRATLAFQYASGTAFAAHGLGARGWAAVNDAEGDPPVSTEQVLHPDRYWDVRDEPTAVSLRGTELLERAGWTPIYDDTLGELDVRLILGPSEADAAAVAAGWDGDRIRALERGDDLIVVWMTVWDTPDDAAEFAGALPRLLSDARVESRDTVVLAVLAPQGVDVDTLAQAVWGASQVG